MFGILFGWRKASKCKNLIKHVQCRLKFLKIKRESIIRQLRDDIAQLLTSGYNENAFSRVEQFFKDQNLLAAYDLLDHFCEFIIIHFPYIRKHKDCPNDISEAVSTLIYAAAWCGDLPELQKIQKLFGERYGRRFAKAAVELYPGTLVNCQIREKLCTKSIPDNVKLRLMDEIAKDYGIHQELFGGKNRVKLHLPKLCGTSDCQQEGLIAKGEAQVNNISFNGAQTPCSYTKDELSEKSFNSKPGKRIAEPPQMTTMQECSVQVENSAQVERSNGPKTIPSLLSGQSSLGSCSSNKLSTVSLENMVEMRCTKPASEISFQSRESVVNFEEAKELPFSLIQDLCGDDKRTFLFNSSIFQLGDGHRFNGESLLCLSSHGYGKNGNDKNMECGQSYGDFYQKFSCQLGQRRKHLGNMPLQKGESSLFVCNEKLWSPQQLHYTRMKQKYMCCDKMQQHILSSKCQYDHRKSYCRCRFCSDMDVRCSLDHPCYYSVMELHNDILIKKCKKFGEAEGSEFLTRFASSHGSSLIESSPHKESGKTSYVSERLSPQQMKGTATENNLETASSQFQRLKRHVSSSHSHVHPKLPDYDELAAKFMALKKEHQQRASARQE